MKKLLVGLLLCLSIPVSASAAPKSVTAKPLEKIVRIGTVSENAGLLLSGSTLVTYGSTTSTTNDALVVGRDFTGKELWRKVIDSGADEIATAGVVDSKGDIWIVGSQSSLGSPNQPDSRTSSAINPDSVITEVFPPTRTDMSTAVIWHLNPTGELVGTLTLALDAPVLLNAASIDAKGISVAGIYAAANFDQTFLARCTSVCVKVANIGGGGTRITSLVSNSDGSISAFGSSTEALGGKKLVGREDGVLIKVAKNGKITSVVRSSAPKGYRIWNSVTPSIFATGSVRTGTKVEAAITKFTTSFVPSWTIRYPSTGRTASFTAGTSSYAFISSATPLTGVIGWKPNTEGVVLLTFDSKGALVAANTSTEASNPLSMAYSKAGGLFAIASTPESVWLFHTPSR